MSRIGRQPIIIPDGVSITNLNGVVTVKGAHVTLQQKLHADVIITQQDGQLAVTVKQPELKEQKALWGLFQRLITNMITGVTSGFSKQLEITGVGFRATVKGDKLVLDMGFSHQIEYHIPAGVTIKVEKNLVTVSGADKQVVGQTAAEIREIKPPEPYKGKGIKYVGEVIRRKVGKTAAKTE